jgi:hypothetical protein
MHMNTDSLMLWFGCSFLGMIIVFGVLLVAIIVANRQLKALRNEVDGLRDELEQLKK